PLPPPVERSPFAGSIGSDGIFRYSIVGGPDTVRQGLTEFLKLTDADELMATAMIHDHSARLRSFELLAGVRDGF
ncbi:MAG TPA: LLM class flavin-dependent oxidoreductase, partial [Polyangiaceae bacterium]